MQYATDPKPCVKKPIINRSAMKTYILGEKATANIITVIPVDEMSMALRLPTLQGEVMLSIRNLV